MRSPEPGGVNADRRARLMDLDAEQGDCLPRRPQPVAVGGRSDEHLGEVDDAEEPGRLPLVPVTEEGAGSGVVWVVAVERADHDVGVEDDPHRSSSSRSSRSK